MRICILCQQSEIMINFLIFFYIYFSLARANSFTSFLLIDAKIEPDMLCHIENIAPGSVASGFRAKFAVASWMARPEFCIPTSIDRAVCLS